MSQENVELTRKVLETFNSRDIEAFVAMMDEKVVAVPRIVGTLGQSVRGREGTRRWRKDLLDIMPDLRVEPVDLRDLGEVTLARATYTGRGARSDTPFVETNWLCWRWRAAKCVEWVSKPTEAEALEAVGLSE
jgi:hypothetical protein